MATWTKDSLRELVNERLGDYYFIVVSSREPYVHRLVDGEIVCERPAGGVTTGLDPVLQASGGMWVATGVGEADREVVDEYSRVAVPPEAPTYTLKRQWLTPEEEEGFYLGFSNNALWPLCHLAYTRPIFRETHWEAYQEVNMMFARAILEEIGGAKAFVFIQDYHFALLSRYLKQRDPSIVAAQFWHIPWPNPETFGICPWQEEVVDGLLGNDVLGFHTRGHALHFMGSVNRCLEARVDYEHDSVLRSEHRTTVGAFPISIDFEQFDAAAQLPEVEREMDRLKELWGISDELVGMGLDRIDYTKGLPERLRAIDMLLARHPEYKERMVFVQMGATSRLQIAAYQSINEEVIRLVELINTRHGSGAWKPIIYEPNDPPAVTRMAARRLAHFAIVSSLHDGMNLVAKEFVGSRFDEDGVLVLSTFTGAAHELVDALQVNPYATDQFARAIHQALVMPREERRRRMQRMRAVVEENNIYRWAGEIISQTLRLTQ